MSSKKDTTEQLDELKELVQQHLRTEERIVTQEQLAEILDISLASVYRLKVRKYYLPGTRKPYYKWSEVVGSLKNVEGDDSSKTL